MICTIANGLTRSGPRWVRRSRHASNNFSPPPIPVATAAADPLRHRRDVDRVDLGLTGHRQQRELREPVHAPRRAMLDPPGRLEVLHLAGECDQIVASDLEFA